MSQRGCHFENPETAFVKPYTLMYYNKKRLVHEQLHHLQHQETERLIQLYAKQVERPNYPDNNGITNSVMPLFIIGVVLWDYL